MAGSRSRAATHAGRRCSDPFDRSGDRPPTRARRSDPTKKAPIASEQRSAPRRGRGECRRRAVGGNVGHNPAVAQVEAPRLETCLLRRGARRASDAMRGSVDFASMRSASGSMLGRWRANLSGLACLASMACATRMRFRGAYWSWRRETAFGSDPGRWPKPAARRRAILEYARWVASMRRLARR